MEREFIKILDHNDFGHYTKINMPATMQYVLLLLIYIAKTVSGKSFIFFNLIIKSGIFKCWQVVKISPLL